jgi:hypothetical protein
LVWIFTIFYGFTFAILQGGSDANSYRDTLIEMHEAKLSFNGVVELLYSEDTSYVDILQPILTFLISLFTDNQHILFAVFGLVFGYFYSRNIAYVLDLLKGKIRPEVLMLILVFAFILPIWLINGFRMWTAAHMFLFGVMPFLAEGKKSRLWVTLLSVFMHFSFIFPLALLALYMATGPRKHLYFIFFISTFFIAQLDLSVVRENLSGIAPDVFEKRVTNYTSQDYADNIKEGFIGVNWYVVWYGKALSWSVMLLLMLIYFKANPLLLANKYYNRLFSFTLYFYGWANIAGFIPSGGRFLNIAHLLAVFSIIIYVHYTKRQGWMRSVVYMVTPLLFLYLLVSIRIGLDSLSVATIFGNPVIALFGKDNIALIELVK